MKKAAFMVMMVTILCKIVAFVREIVLSYSYGASGITDAYLVSRTIPSVIFSFIGAGIATGFIPLYSRILNEQGHDDSDRFTNNLINALLLLASFIVAIVLLFTQPIVKLFASGFTGGTLELAITFTRIGVFGVYVSAILRVLAGYLVVHGDYLVPILIDLPMNLIIIMSLLFSTRTTVHVLAVGSVLASASRLLLLAPFVRKNGYQYQPTLNLTDNNMKTMVLIALPVIVGTSVNEINVLVDRTIASSVAVGGISALNYANRLNGFIQSVFVFSITTVMYPMISKMAAEKNVNGLKIYVSEAISLINLLVVPAIMGAMVFSKEIVALLFGRGAFTPDAIEMTSSALFYYSIGMGAFGLRDILSRAFYALQDTKTPMINATIAVVLNIVLNVILSRYMGIGGLALATSISAVVSALLMIITLRKKIGSFGLQEVSGSFIKIGIASVFMGFFAIWGFKLMGKILTKDFALILAIGLSALVYAVLIFFLKVPQVERMLEIVKNRLSEKTAEREERESVNGE